jgi:hypothetical protein
MKGGREPLRGGALRGELGELFAHALIAGILRENSLEVLAGL